MIFLYIFLGLLLLIFLLSLIPVGVDARYRTKLYCRVKIGFLKILVIPNKKLKKKKTKKQKEERKLQQKEKEFSLKKLFSQNGVSGIINILKKMASVAAGALKDVFSHIIIRELVVDITVAGDDAADTAMNYGYACSAVYPAVSILTGVTKCRGFKVMVSPDFTDGAESRAMFRFSGDIKIFWLVKAALQYGFRALLLLMKFKKARQQKPLSQEDENLHNSGDTAAV